MPYLPHSLFVMGGTIGTGTDAEIWQCGIRGYLSYAVGSDPVASNLAARQALLAQWKTPLQTWFASTGAAMRTDAALTFMKLNSIGPDGKYVYPAYPLTVAANAGGIATPTRPDFVMNCWSWKTARFSGPASNGRIYPPNCVPPTTAASSRIASSATLSQATAAVALLAILKTSPPTPIGTSFVPIVASEQGVSEAITGVRVGDVFDVQRRRKDALREVYCPVQPVP